MNTTRPHFPVTWRYHSGFSLLEILVAFSIMSLSLGVLLQIFGTGLKTATLSDRYTVATTHAKSRLAEVGLEIPLEEGSVEGSIDDIFQWQIKISPHQWLAEDEDDTIIERVPYNAFEVECLVSWGQARKRSVKLTTLRLAKRTSCVGCLIN